MTLHVYFIFGQSERTTFISATSAIFNPRSMGTAWNSGGRISCHMLSLCRYVLPHGIAKKQSCACTICRQLVRRLGFFSLSLLLHTPKCGNATSMALIYPTNIHAGGWSVSFSSLDYSHTGNLAKVVRLLANPDGREPQRYFFISCYI